MVRGLLLCSRRIFSCGSSQTASLVPLRSVTSSPLLLSAPSPRPSEGVKERDSNRSRIAQCQNGLYPGHITTTASQKILLTFNSAYSCLTDPARDDMVAVFGETSGSMALRHMRRKMLADPVGRQILQDQPVINTRTVDINHLGTLPEGTFGKEYWHFLQDNNFSPDARRSVKYVDDLDLMYVMLRYRQVHDLVHVLLEMPPNMLGEVLVKWFEGVQTGLPMCYTTALLWPYIRLGPKDRAKYHHMYLRWAVRSGSTAMFLMNVYFEKHWETNLAELRRELNVEPAPVPLRKRKERPEE
ncbi:hypothetical protein RRG08_019564 [Elysia crispata]|uniref:Ubiquinone biosynthesis protein COQ4 homolog, mitochondrial n=1 Tax=Elysia crispata TaxID=231223 RepID=A0AAE0YSC8_9GAST|nr:hypothetical protein RRG08_019564 [Elysia crispata]